MFCRNCGGSVDDKAVACIKCGANPRVGQAFCANCGEPSAPTAVVCVKCGVSLAAAALPGAEKKIVAGIFGIVLGCLGIHKFILGYTTQGLIMLLVSVLTAPFTCGLGAVPMAVIGLIEGILYLVKSDQEFVQTYILNKKTWF